MSGMDVIDDYESESKEIKDVGNDFFTYSNEIRNNFFYFLA